MRRRDAIHFPRRPSLPPPAAYLAPMQYKRIPEAELQRGSGAVKRGGVNFSREKRLRSAG